MTDGRLSFSQVVGQDAAKRALLLAAIQPRLAGVLLRGDKGSAKTTLARGLAALLPGDAPFVELPLGASEDRVIGSIDLTQLLADGRPAFRPGLLAAAHGGVLYVDEINLLADHLVDALLDAAATGANRVERDGISHSHPARFVLVGSMNPEEGELRPQLLDRFGLAVDITTTDDPGERALAVRRQLASERIGHLRDRETPREQELRDRIAHAARLDAELPDDVIDTAARLAVAVGAEGLRADLMLCRAATAAAALDGDAVVTDEHLRSVAELVLAHRRRRRPFDEPGMDQEELDDAWQRATAPPEPDDSADDSADDEGEEPPGDDEQHDAPDTAGPARLRLPTSTPSAGRSNAGRFAEGDSSRGRIVRAGIYQPDVGIDAHATAVAAAQRPDRQPGDPVGLDDLRSTERRQRATSLVVFVLDTSASMGVERRMAATKAAVLGMLGDAYRRRGRVALVTFHHEQADVVLRPTASIEIAGARLAEMTTGGTTPLAAGLDAARQLIEPHLDATMQTHVVAITDGRATHGDGDPVADARAAAQRLARAATSVTFVDTEQPGAAPLGLARELAEACDASYVHLDALDGTALEAAARRVADA